MFWTVCDPFPEIIGRVVRKLEGTVLVVLSVADIGELFVGILVRGLSEVVGKCGERRADHVEAV